MTSLPRYEVVDTIATGDFATVYRARDRELGREVAVKQIHQHFLHDERQLARYWQEAQLLASLQHPNILTIYDLVRSRGWLILELMRGSMKQVAQGEPIDLDFLRVALACTLNALHFLHTNGIIHGDVKPSNLLLDTQNRVKLGDFGLARRAMSEEGSLLKGTTKYMAPELVSNQFGAVGPGSDIYSLGFTAYELMCGAQFEALFPGLGAFGRDQQIAWMMWHAAPDRHLPEVGRVLQGVPEDLARVIQKMSTKDQSRRYASAMDALRDLRPDRMAAGMLAEQPDEDMAQKAKSRRRKRLGILGGTFAACVVAMVLIFSRQAPTKPPAAPPKPTHGTIRDVFPDENKFIVEAEDGGKRSEVTVRAKDQWFINHKETRVIRDLQPGDLVEIETRREEGKGKFLVIQAFRPEYHKGVIKEVKADLGHFVLDASESEGAGKTRQINVPTSLKIVLNGETQVQRKTEEKGVVKLEKGPIELRDLKPGDRVVVGDIGEETGLRATSLVAERVVAFDGILRNVDDKKHEFTFDLGEGDNPERVIFPYVPNCAVTLNFLSHIDQQILKPVDLHAGDKVTVKHDSRVVAIDAHRVMGQEGTLASVDLDGGQLMVTLEGSQEPRAMAAVPSCKITLGGEPAELDDLRPGDKLDMTLGRSDAKVPEVTAVSVRRPPDATRWALLIGNQDFDDPQVSRLSTPVADAKMLSDVLTKRYAVKPEQSLLLTDETLVRLQNAIPNLLGGVNEDAKLLVYFGGHAFKDAEGAIYLAPKNYQLKDPAGTGLPLQWLLDQLEACKSKEKLLLLDCAQAGDTPDLKAEPSTAEMVRTLKGPPGYNALRTLTAVASCKAGQRGQVLAARHHSVFAWTVAQGYAGKADKLHNNRIEATALFAYLPGAMAAAVAEGKLAEQVPELFLPNPQPPRLDEKAKTAIRKLAAWLHQDKVDPQQVKADFDAATEAAGKELEPKLIYILVLLKAKTPRSIEKAYAHSQEILAEHPEYVVLAQVMAWVQFEQRHYKAGVDLLGQLAPKVPPLKNPNDPYPETIQRVFFWTGQLRQFCAEAITGAYRPTDDAMKAVDDAVVQYGPDALRCYEAGRDKTRSLAADFDKRIAAAEAGNNKATSAMLEIERHQLRNYVVFSFDDAEKLALALMGE